MTIFGCFIKFTWRNEKTGLSTLLVESDKGLITCRGITPPLANKAPLSLTGEYKEDRLFDFTKISLCGYTEEAMENYLCKSTSKTYRIGPVAAKKIIAETGPDVFAYVRKHATVEQALSKMSYNTDVVRSALLGFKNETDFEELLEYVLKIGGTYHSAIKLRNNLNSNALYAIKKNPYLLLYSDTPKDAVEKEAQDLGIPAFDERRVSAIVMHTLEQSEKKGNTRMLFDDLFDAIRIDERKVGYNTKEIYIAAELTKQCYRVVEEDDGVYIYKEETYLAEKSIADNIRRLQVSANKLPYNPAYISLIEKELGIHYSDEQKEAFNLLNSSGVKVVTGGPGTGKTTFLNGLIRMYKQMMPYGKITLCAPTGRAAARMSDSTGLSATTIHKLLKITPSGGNGVKIDSDFIIADESSMDGVDIFNRLLSAVKNGALVLILGDKNQLPSIDAGNVLDDIVESGVVSTYRFNTIFRQKNGNSIIDNAYRIKEGNVGLVSDDNFKIIRYKNSEAMLDALKMLCARTKSEFTLFTATRKAKYETGSIMLNKLVGEIKKTSTDGVVYGYYHFHVGDKIVFNRNDYDAGYYNGEIGTITDIQKHGDIINMSILADGETLYLRNGNLNDIELGYALTAHKAQGSECDNAVIVVSQKPYNMLQRKLLYVEITRAKKNVLIISEGDALEKCIIDEKEKPRCTGLKYHLLHNHQ